MGPTVLLVGILILVAAIRGTLGDLWTLVKGDFIGQNNFIFWAVAIGVIWAAGKIDTLKPVSNAFLVLVLVVLFLTHQGFFGNLQAALQGTTTVTPSAGSNPPGLDTAGATTQTANPVGLTSNLYPNTGLSLGSTSELTLL